MTDRIHHLFGLAGKRAVVTGGSRGIGEMITEGLVDAGADVITTARKEDALRATADRTTLGDFQRHAHAAILGRARSRASD